MLSLPFVGVNELVQIQNIDQDAAALSNLWQLTRPNELPHGPPADAEIALGLLHSWA